MFIPFYFRHAFSPIRDVSNQDADTLPFEEILNLAAMQQNLANNQQIKSLQQQQAPNQFLGQPPNMMPANNNQANLLESGAIIPHGPNIPMIPAALPGQQNNNSQQQPNSYHRTNNPSNHHTNSTSPHPPAAQSVNKLKPTSVHSSQKQANNEVNSNANNNLLVF